MFFLFFFPPNHYSPIFFQKFLDSFYWFDLIEVGFDFIWFGFDLLNDVKEIEEGDQQAPFWWIWKEKKKKTWPKWREKKNVRRMSNKPFFLSGTAISFGVGCFVCFSIKTLRTKELFLSFWRRTKLFWETIELKLFEKWGDLVPQINSFSFCCFRLLMFLVI